MKNKRNILANIEVKAPKKLITYGSGVKAGKTNLGTCVINTVIDAIIMLALINPNPYSTNINMLFLGVLAIPKDQKKKMALSSHGIAVCRIPNKNAGIKMMKYS